MMRAVHGEGGTTLTEGKEGWGAWPGRGSGWARFQVQPAPSSLATENHATARQDGGAQVQSHTGTCKPVLPLGNGVAFGLDQLS
jgi:hypothetical protein